MKYALLIVLKQLTMGHNRALSHLQVTLEC